MKIELPRSENQKEEELQLKKICLDMAVKICLAKSYSDSISPEKVIEVAERLKEYLKDRREG